jgi:hypothetical protein
MIQPLNLIKNYIELRFVQWHTLVLVTYVPS